jgi:hypothetical protein
MAGTGLTRTFGLYFATAIADWSVAIYRCFG